MSKEETGILKGIAIIMMFWHHLFGCGTELTNGVYFPYYLSVGSFGNLFAVGCKLCIALFTIASGIGLYNSYISKDSYSKIILRIVKFLITYWTMLFLCAIPYLIITHKFNPEYLLVNMFALLHNDSVLYLSLSWYVKVYLELLIVLPLIKYISGKIDTLWIDVSLLILIPLYIAQKLPYAEETYVDFGTAALSSLKLLFTYLPVLYTGVVIEKYKILDFIRNDSKSEKHYATDIKTVISLIMLALITIFWAKGYFTPYSDVICSLLFVVVFDYLYRKFICTNKVVNKLLTFIGKYSFQFWLLSGMFYFSTNEFTWLLYLPKVTFLICIWNFVILTPFAFGYHKISEVIIGYVTPLYERVSCRMHKSSELSE